MLVLVGFPDTLHPAYMSAFDAILLDVCVVTNLSEAEILVRAEPSRNIWHEQRILCVLGIRGVKE
eukprot:14983832-Alexandrium_andersonii.AAC.1